MEAAMLGPLTTYSDLQYKTPRNIHSALAKYMAEFVGTFFLVFTVGCNIHAGSIGAALSIGAILSVMIYSLGSVSGAHLNPAVTVAVGLTGRGKINCQDAACYIASQLVGGVLGGLCYWTVFNDAFLLQPNHPYSAHDASAVEILYTTALCYVVLNVATTEHKKQGNVPNNFFGLAIGFTVTAAAIAVGPISGCSLNPAVSVGSLLARKMAEGTTTTSVWALYCLSPLGGAAIAALLFYFVQGGLTDQFEYEVIGSPPASPAPTRVYMSRVPEKRHNNRFLVPGEVFWFDEQTVNHKIFFGLMWEVSETCDETPDIDASCVKFAADGSYMGCVYFAERFGKENRKCTGSDDAASIIVHTGDNATGHGSGFGMLSTIKHKKKGKPQEEVDDEKIEIRRISRLEVCQPRAKYLFFCVNVYSAAHKFEHIKQMRVRVVDADEGDKEICRFDKKDWKNSGNGFVLGVLYNQDNEWRFKVLDLNMEIGEHGTYREHQSKLAPIVRKLEGLDM